MTNTWKTLGVVGALWLSTVSAGEAQSERYLDPEKGLSVEEAVKGALAREPSLRAARSDIDAARAMQMQAALRPNPSTSLERREQPAGTDNQTMVGVEWPLDLFRKNARVAVAERETEATTQSVADRARLLAAEVRTKYGRAAAEIRRLAIAENLSISGQRELGLLRRRVEEGASTPLDRDLLDVAVRRLDAERLLAAGRTEAALYELRRVLGLPADTPLKIRDTLDLLMSRPDTAPSSSLPPLNSQTVQNRPDVREAAARVQVFDARITRARSEGRFDMSVFGSYTRMDTAFPQRGFAESGQLEPVRGVFGYLGGGVMVTVPIRNRHQGDIAAAEAEKAGAAARLEAAQLAAQSEIAAAAVEDAQAKAAVAVLQDGVRLARQNLDVMRQTYELGRMTLQDVLTEQRQYLDLEQSYTEMLEAAYNTRVTLRTARGEQP